MNEIKVAENKTLKLTNVVARRIAPEELGNMMVALTQLQNFIKSHNAQPSLYRPHGLQPAGKLQAADPRL